MVFILTNIAKKNLILSFKTSFHMETCIKVEGNLITVSGVVGAREAEKMVAAMAADNVYTIDFNEVSEIKFAALRALLNFRRGAGRFSIINAQDSVMEKFEDSGVASFINICRKPKPLDISKYQEFGKSFMSKAYNSEDGDSMIKIYGPHISRSLALQEKVTARAVMVFGIPTPLVGTVYTDGTNTAIDFERIEGKRSFSRIMSEEPQRMEEMSKKFARMCRDLHNTPCDTSIFPDRSVIYRQTILSCKDLTEEEKQKLVNFIDKTPKATTCLHGDMQMSNVITTGKEDMWIDLADFGYGYPLFDLGMLLFQIKYAPEEIVKDLFHLDRKQMLQVWRYFMEEYFSADTPEKKAAAEASIEPFCTLHMTLIGTQHGFVPGMVEGIKAMIARFF